MTEEIKVGSKWIDREDLKTIAIVTSINDNRGIVYTKDGKTLVMKPLVFKRVFKPVVEMTVAVNAKEIPEIAKLLNNQDKAVNALFVLLCAVLDWKSEGSGKFTKKIPDEIKGYTGTPIGNITTMAEPDTFEFAKKVFNDSDSLDEFLKGIAK